MYKQQPVNITHDYTKCSLYTVDPPDDEQQACSKHAKAYYYYYYYYYYSALGLVWGGTRAQSGDRYGSGTMYPGQVLGDSLPLLSPERHIIEIN